MVSILLLRRDIRPSSAGAFNDSRTGGGIGFNARVPLLNKKVDAGIHFLAAGHHATETFGVRRLGELLARQFGVRHVYVDVPNPI